MKQSWSANIQEGGCSRTPLKNTISSATDGQGIETDSGREWDIRKVKDIEFTRIDIINDRLKKGFAHHFLLSRKFLDSLYPTVKGMKQANLSTNAMKKLQIVLPCEAEQSEIATCFKSLDQKVVVAGRKVAVLQDIFRTLLHELMTAKTRVSALKLTSFQ